MGGWNDTSASRATVLGDAAICLIIALILRFSAFGDPNIHIDETFYFYVGLEMHQGAVPYVDIWDRKPLGLFILYWLFAGISSSVLAYQIPAWLFASYTAWVVSRIVSLFGSRLAGIMGAAIYLVTLHPLNGQGGQSPIFYNALISSAAWLVLLSDERLNRGEVPKAAWGAMALCGLALTIKQTTVFEGVFLGLWIVWRLWRSRMPLPTLVTCTAGFAALGALPFVSIGAWYWANGYWEFYWHAMITSNLDRAPVIAFFSNNALVILHAIGLLSAGALASMVLARRYKDFLPYRTFLALWLTTALLGVVVIANFFDHYALPLVTPLAVIVSAHFGRSLAGTVLGVTIFSSTFFLAKPIDFETHRKSREHFYGMLADIRKLPDHDSAYIIDGPPLIYAERDINPMTVLVFPTHMSSDFEYGTSPIDERAELHRIMEAGPDIIVMNTYFEDYPEGDLRKKVIDYSFSKCRVIHKSKRSQKREKPFTYLVFSNCSEPFTNSAP